MLSAGAALPPDVREYLMKAGEAAQAAAAEAAARGTTSAQQQGLPTP
jgi:hypothetical protein